jgi:outer membrane protein insertion porin family
MADVERKLLQFFAATLLVCVAPAVRAQQPGQPAPKASKIAGISVTGTRKFPTDQIATASGLKIGDVVSAEQIQAAADRLAALGIFSTVNYRFASKGDAISLEFQVQEAPTVPLSFDNFPWFTDDELAAAIRQDIGLFTGESPESGTMVDEISDVLDKLLASRHIKGNLIHQLVAPPAGEGMMLQFQVDDPALKVQSVKFDDPLARDSERLKDRVSDIKGQPYSRFAIEVFENEQVRPLYASKGYVRAKIGPPQPHISGNADDPAALNIEVLIPISPGSVYSWNGASWHGNTIVPSANLDGVVGMKPGEVADGMKIEALWRDVESEYTKKGYLDAKLDAQPDFDDTAHRVSYRVNITEGPQYRMGELVITGLSLDAEKRLQHAWQLAPGQIFDNDYFEKVLKVLAKPSPEIFGEMPIHYNQCGHWLRPNADRHTVDVLLDFK